MIEEMGEAPFNRFTSVDFALFVHQGALCNFLIGNRCLEPQTKLPANLSGIGENIN